jgi:hypothetical protein
MKRSIALRMKRPIALLILITLCVLAWPGFASIYHSAQRGDMEKAFVLWKPLTENGGEVVQTLAAVIDEDRHSPVRQASVSVPQHAKPVQVPVQLAAVSHVPVKPALAPVERDKDTAGYSQDYRAGLIWLERHADAQTPVQGLSDSMFDTVQRSPRKDKVTEYMRLSSAAKNGDKKSLGYLSLIEKEMTPHQIALANRLAGDDNGESGR